MRIHLPLHASQFAVPAAAGPSTPPLVQLGGDLVIVELQGELNYEGEKSDGVIGVIGLDRPDKPTLHLGPHHLLHGKFMNLQKPYAVIRRVVGDPAVTASGAMALEGDAHAEESGDDHEGDDGSDEADEYEEEGKPRKGKGKEKESGQDDDEEEEEEEEETLFEPNPDIFPTTPTRSIRRQLTSSSPISIPATPLDYSSELDMSSPARSEMDEFGFPASGSHDHDHDSDDDDENENGRSGGSENGEEEERGAKRSKLNTTKSGPGGHGKKQEKNGKEGKKRKSQSRSDRTTAPGKERTRHYEVVGVVRRKVVFNLRPEPLVAPTVLPE